MLPNPPAGVRLATEAVCVMPAPRVRAGARAGAGREEERGGLPKFGAPQSVKA